MSVIIAIINIAALSFIFWKFYQHAEILRQHFWVALFLKLMAGVSLGLLYQYYYAYGDTITYFEKGSQLAQLFFDDWVSYFNFLSNSSSVIFESGFERQPRALFFVKIVSFFSIITSGNYWVSSLYFSGASFLAAFYLASIVSRAFEPHKNIIAICFLYFPSTLFWTSGIIKESLAAVALFCLVGLVFNAVSNKKLSVIQLLSIVFSALMLWKIKYYYAAVTFTALIAFVATYIVAEKFQVIRSTKWLILLTYIISVVILILGVTQLHPNLQLENLPGVVVKNYNAFTSISDVGAFIEYENLTPTFRSILYNSPKAILSGLFRPFLWETDGNILRGIYSIENLVVLLLLLFNLAYLRSIKNYKNFIMVISILFYVCTLVAFLALSTPNFGTLARYKSLVMPFLLLILMIKNPYIQKLSHWKF